jgi:hypothetical protein
VVPRMLSAAVSVACGLLSYVQVSGGVFPLVPVLIWKYITGTDRRSVRGQTVFALTHPFNARYAVEHPFFAPILAVCQARAITYPIRQ